MSQEIIRKALEKDVKEHLEKLNQAVNNGIHLLEVKKSVKELVEKIEVYDKLCPIAEKNQIFAKLEKPKEPEDEIEPIVEIHKFAETEGQVIYKEFLKEVLLEAKENPYFYSKHLAEKLYRDKNYGYKLSTLVGYIGATVRYAIKKGWIKKDRKYFRRTESLEDGLSEIGYIISDVSDEDLKKLKKDAIEQRKMNK